MDTNPNPGSPPASVRRQVGTLALALGMLLSAVGGGVVGSLATLSAVPRPAATPPSLALPVAAPVGEAAPRGEAAQATAVANVREDSAITRVFRAVSPAVVSITRGGAGGPFGEGRARGEGSGVVVDASGLILTNNHVVEGTGRLTVRFADGSSVPGTVLGTDPGTDLAVVKVELPPGQPVAVLGDSDQVEPGQTAIAIGSPFGLPQTVTAGIVSAVNREWGAAGGRPMRGLIQTDAPVNPGNSGGPLLNLRGEVIGILNAIESPIRGSVGVGFAIPANEARRLLPRLARGERVEHPWLGISGSALTPQLATELGLSVQQGVLVFETVPDGPAARAGLRGGRRQGESDVPLGGDVITAIDGHPVRSVQELSAQINTRQVGDQVRLTVLRDGQTLELPVTLGAWPVSQRG